jgi:hypothetical protein
MKILPDWMKKRVVAAVHQVDGPTSAGGASMNIYVFEDGSIETQEYGWLGDTLARYEGPPRDVPPGTRMPDPPPRPLGAAPLPPPVGTPPPSPAHPPAYQAAPTSPPPSRKSAS